MSSETIYKCDCCGKKVEQGELINVNIVMTIGSKIVAKGYKYSHASRKDACLTCAEKFKLIIKVVQEDEVKAVSSKTTPEKLYEAVSEIVWENQQHQ